MKDRIHALERENITLFKANEALSAQIDSLRARNMTSIFDTPSNEHLAGPK